MEGLMTTNIFANNAGKYVSLGWAIFPLAEGEKVPMKGTDGFKSASVSRAQISIWCRRFPHANIGLATGKISGVLVIDLDPRSGCNETLAKLAKQGKLLGDTIEAASPRDGRHLYFAYDPRITVSKANALGSGIDVKTDGGYITAPPSFWRRNGRPYTWSRPPRGSDLPRLPQWVILALQPAPEPIRKPLKAIDFGNEKGYRRQALADLDEAIRRMAALSDGRHEAPFKIASALGKYVTHKLLTESDIEDAVMNACSLNGALQKYTRTDLLKQIRNGLKKASGDNLPPLARVHRNPELMPCG
jgi:Bifunctional DNA primase/polymerase, N-terminal